MEEIQTRDGRITNASFTDYLIPTALDMPPVESVLIEDPEPDAPYGVKGVGEPPTVVSTAAVVAAMRDATGKPLAPGAGPARRDRRAHCAHVSRSRGTRLARRGRTAPFAGSASATDRSYAGGTISAIRPRRPERVADATRLTPSTDRAPTRLGP